MEKYRREARNRWLVSGGLLLAGVSAFLGVFTGSAWAAPLPMLAAILVAASAAAAIGAVAVGSHSMNRGKRTVLLWSSWALALEIAIAVTFTGFEAAIMSPVCDGTNGSSPLGCAASYAINFIWIGGLLAIAAIVAVVGAVLTGLTCAAQGGERWWFTAILASFIVALCVVVWSSFVLFMPQLEGFASIESVQGWLIPLAPLVIAILMALFSLSGARQPERAAPVGV